ncbi:unnamed protein product [Heterobilharzia americana]|nr:unnamed protein product [Heterobilharzia americana]
MDAPDCFCRDKIVALHKEYLEKAFASVTKDATTYPAHNLSSYIFWQASIENISEIILERSILLSVLVISFFTDNVILLITCNEDISRRTIVLSCYWQCGIALLDFGLSYMD